MEEVKKYLKENCISMVLLAAIFVGLFALMIHNCILDFDAGMNFQVSKSIVDRGQYATNYVDSGYNASESLLFDHKIQTGSTIIFPTALLNAIFGVKPIHMQIVLYIVYCILLFSIYYIISKRVNNVIGLLITVFFIPYTYFNPFYGYGEIAMGTVMLLTFLMFLSARESGLYKKYLFAGILFGFGYLTKTVFMICAPTYFVFFVYDMVQGKNKKDVFLRYLTILGGFIIPVAVFEIYKMVSLGGVVEYVSWWKQEIACIRTESGTNDEIGGIIGLLKRIVTNIKWYADTFNMPIVFLLFMMLFPIGYFIYSYIKKIKINSLDMCFYIVFMTYMAWWLLIVSGSRLSERRIMMANIFGIINITLLIADIIKLNIQKNKIVFTAIGLVYACLMIVIFIPKCISEYKGLNTAYERKQAVDEAVSFMKTLPENSNFYGSGWWQNPVIAVEANVTMLNIDCQELRPDSYFVEDVYMNVCSDTLNNMKSKYYVETVFENSECKVCKISNDRDERIEKTGNYIYISAAMNYWGKITIDCGNNTIYKYNYNANMGHIYIEIPDINITDLNIKFDNYIGEITDIKRVIYCKKGEKTELYPENKSGINLDIQNDEGISEEP